MKDLELCTAYREFMDKYAKFGQMKPATHRGKYFIPHHAVVKRNEQGIRVVFDASTKTSSDRSLNDYLPTGLKLQMNISHILLRTWFKKFIIIADIAMMFYQILIYEIDRVFQYVLWRNLPQEKVKEFE